MNKRGMTIFFAAILGLIAACQPDDSQTKTRNIAAALPVPKMKRMSYEQYGIDVRQREVHQSQLEEGQKLTDILAAHSVSGPVIAEAAEKAHELVDLKRIPTGSSFTILKDGKGQVDYFILEQNPTDYVVFDFRDSVRVSVGRREVTHHTYLVQGKIKASLFESVSDQGGNPGITSRLQEIFAWTVDFFRLQPDDRFAVVYREQYVEGSSIGLDRIEAAYMRVDSQDHFAFLVEHDSTPVYVDQSGKSLKRAFLKAPLRIATLPQTWTRNRRWAPVYHPANGEIQYFMPPGTEIFSVGEGKISDIKKTDQGHYHLIIDHENGYQTTYHPLESLSGKLKVGQELSSGAYLGRVASDPSQRSHSLRLHYLKEGVPQSPETVESLPAFELGDEEFKEWLPVMQRLRNLLLDESENRQISSWQPSLTDTRNRSSRSG